MEIRKCRMNLRSSMIKSNGRTKISNSFHLLTENKLKKIERFSKISKNMICNLTMMARKCNYNQGLISTNLSVRTKDHQVIPQVFLNILMTSHFQEPFHLKERCLIVFRIRETKSQSKQYLINNLHR